VEWLEARNLLSNVGLPPNVAVNNPAEDASIDGQASLPPCYWSTLADAGSVGSITEDVLPKT
jgi:hypothetical protein